MSEEDFPTQEEQEKSVQLIRSPGLEEKPELEEDLLAEIAGLVKAQLAGESTDGSS